NEPWTVKVRARNTSVATWHFRPGANTGIHCGWLITTEAGKLVTRGKAGLFFADVPPGQSIDLILAIPPLTVGRYCLMVDMLEERNQGWFYHQGSKPLMQEGIQVGP